MAELSAPCGRRRTRGSTPRRRPGDDAPRSRLPRRRARRLLLPQPWETAAGHVLEALAELLLCLHQRRARQYEYRVGFDQAARDFDVILIAEPGSDRHRHDLAIPLDEHDVAAAAAS